MKTNESTLAETIVVVILIAAVILMIWLLNFNMLLLIFGVSLSVFVISFALGGVSEKLKKECVFDKTDTTPGHVDSLEDVIKSADFISNAMALLTFISFVVLLPSLLAIIICGIWRIVF